MEQPRNRPNRQNRPTNKKKDSTKKIEKQQGLSPLIWIMVVVFSLGGGFLFGMFRGGGIAPASNPLADIGQGIRETHTIHTGLQALEITEDIEGEEPLIEFLKEELKGYAKVHYRKEYSSVEINPTDPNFLDDVHAMLNGEKDASEWQELEKQIVRLSKRVGQALDNESAALTIVNPAYPENFLLTAVNGEVIYNVQAQ